MSSRKENNSKIAKLLGSDIIRNIKDPEFIISLIESYKNKFDSSYFFIVAPKGDKKITSFVGVLLNKEIPVIKSEHTSDVIFCIRSNTDTKKHDKNYFINYIFDRFIDNYDSKVKE